MAESSLFKDCAICEETYRDPRILECAHHFCKVCLEEIAEKHPQGYTTCPICRHVTETDHGVKAVEALPRYRMLNYFIEDVKKLESNTGDSSTGKQCDVCWNHVAMQSCLQCQKNYCDKCIKGHDELEKEAGHLVYPTSKYMFCSEHDTHAAFICQQCAVVCCPKCTQSSHHHHAMADIHEMTTNVRERLLKRRNELEFDDQGEMLHKSVREVLQQTELVKSETSKAADALVDSLKQLIRKVECIKSDANGKLVSAIKTITMYESDMSGFLNAKSTLVKVIDRLAEHASPHEMAVRESSLPRYQADNISDMFTAPVVEIPDIHTSLNEFKEKVDTYRDGLTLITTDHEISRKIGEPIRNPKRTAFFNAGGNLWGIAIDRKESTVVVRRNDADRPITVYDCKGVELKSLGTCVPGIAGTPYQGIAIDTKRNLYVLPVKNGKVVTLRKDGAIVSTIVVIHDKYQLHGICYSKKDLYVTCSSVDQSGTNCVYLIDANSMVVTTTIQKIRSPWSVSCGVYRGTLAIIVCGYNHSVTVMDYNGKEMQTFGTRTGGSGPDQLSYPWGVSTDSAGRLLVCDQSNNRVVSVSDDSWEVLLDHTNLVSSPFHIATDLIKMMLVVGSHDGCICCYKY